jgi:two-component system, response regulator
MMATEHPQEGTAESGESNPDVVTAVKQAGDEVERPPAGILLVEDNDGHVELIRQNLLRMGISEPLERVRDGLEALDYLGCKGLYLDRSDVKPVVVILDIGLPGVDGFEVLRQVKSDPRYQRVPFVVLTMAESPEVLSRCYELGCEICRSKWAVFADFGHFAELIREIISLARSAYSRTP